MGRICHSLLVITGIFILCVDILQPGAEGSLAPQVVQELFPGISPGQEGSISLYFVIFCLNFLK